MSVDITFMLWRWHCLCRAQLDFSLNELITYGYHLGCYSFHSAHLDFEQPDDPSAVFAVKKNHNDVIESNILHQSKPGSIPPLHHAAQTPIAPQLKPPPAPHAPRMVSRPDPRLPRNSYVAH